MKRGLVVLAAEEVGDQEWARRVRAVQRKLVADGVSVALIYGDVYRSDDIGYLTNLCLYWNEGILAIPAEGEPVFLTKLSPRVHTWMRATSRVSDLRSGKAFGPLVRDLLNGTPGVLGLVDQPLWPADLVGEVTAAAEGWQVRPLEDVVRQERLVPSPAELALLRDAATVLRTAFDEAARPGLAAAERIGLLEHGLRGNGYSDVFAGCTTTGDGSTTLEMTGQYRNGWLHEARTLDADATSWATALDSATRDVLGALGDGTTVADLNAAAAPALAELPSGVQWHVTCVNQADLATGGEYLATRSEPLTAGMVVAAGLELLFADGGRAAAAQTVLIGPNGAEELATAEKEPAR